MNREQFDTWWKSKGHTPSDTDYQAYQLGQKTSTQTLQGSVEAQQDKIAEQIRKAGARRDSDTGKSPTPPTVNHHPQHHYQSWGEYSGNLQEMGYAVTRAQYESYLRSLGINTQSDHDISRQTIHSGDQGTGSISKKEPEHVHDQKQGKITIPDRHQGRTKPPKPVTPPVKPPPVTPPPVTPPPADSPTPLPTQRTEMYTYPYKNLPFDPSRPPPEVGDPFYSLKYQEQLTAWSNKNWPLYQRKQPLFPKPLPPKETVLRERKFMEGKRKDNKDIINDTLKNTKFIPAKDIRISVYTKQKPYYLEINGVRQPGLYNIEGKKFDETGPRLTDLGLIKEGYSGSVASDTESIRDQAWSRGFDLLGVGASWLGAAAATSKAAAAVSVRAAAQRAIARNAARLRNLSRSSRLGRFGGRNPGSAAGLRNRGAASVGNSLGSNASRIGELPMSGASQSAVSGGGAEVLENFGL